MRARRTAPDIAADRAPLWKRLAWLAAIWATSVLALGVVAYGLRLWLKA
ncbi:MAG: DUF2474 domain-containing protein [Sphingomonadales bacterium]|nr:DUF2474 domain-containing protein [Sphingomonadales bacterium]MDE2570482.1 DUF2474 domain-containing protein [Sphingomonadales bacterium]